MPLPPRRTLAPPLVPAVVLIAALAGCSTETNISTLKPTIALSPEVLDFGEVVANEETKTLEVYIANEGQAKLIADLAIPDEPAMVLVGDPHVELDVDASITLEVTFSPTELASYEAKLEVESNDYETPGIVVPLLGLGRVPYRPCIEVSPSISVFEGVPQNTDWINVVSISNTCDADLEILSVEQAGAGTFDIRDSDPTGAIIPPGQKRDMFVTYRPIREEGDEGTITLHSNDPDNPTVSIGLEGNGGGDFEYPVATIACPGQIDLAGPQVVSLDGSGSYDPLGSQLTYDWDVVLIPTGADPNRTVDPLDAAVTSLLVDAAGEWEVTLVVTTEDGLPSVPARCRMDAVPADKLHVELAWRGSTSDMDLHLARTLDAGFFTTPDDVSWCNANPDWGTLGATDDDPRLDLDDDDGYGPEDINIFEPATGEYKVRVHFFDDNDDGDTTAVISVFTYGQLQWEGTKVLERNEVWDVGQINWPQGTFGTDDTVWDAEGVRECR